MFVIQTENGVLSIGSRPSVTKKLVNSQPESRR